MNIKEAKGIIEGLIRSKIDNTELHFTKSDFKLVYKKNNYEIVFYIYVENYFKEELKLYSDCHIKLNLLFDFYSKYKIPYPESSQVFMAGNVGKLYNIFQDSGNDFHSKPERYFIKKDIKIDENIINISEDLINILLIVFEKIKFELDNNLSSDFDSEKDLYSNIRPSDKVVLTHFFKPENLKKALRQLRVIFKMDGFDRITFEKYNLIIKTLCELHSYNYSEYEIRLNFFQKLKYKYS